MFIIYDLIFFCIALLYLPSYLFRRKFHRGFLVRLGLLPKNLELGRPIWIHAVSVGEALAVKGLIEGLRKLCPEKKIVISTVTATGNKVVKGFVKEQDFVTYLPLDFSWAVKSAIDRVNPGVFVIAETEIWPNLIAYLRKKNIPVITVNGRISDSSFRGYSLLKLFIRHTLRKVSLFLLQTERDSQRLKFLGVEADKIKITGNMKFDGNDQVDAKKDISNIKLKLGLRAEEKLFVAGSTHKGEEEIIVRAWKELKADHPGLRLLIAPRHPERAKDIEKIISGFGYPSALCSKLPAECSLCTSHSVFILDTMGELSYYYALADLVFVGGSLIRKGGHNLLEPASLFKPIIIGPHMFNFRDIADMFIENRAAVMVYDADSLKDGIRKILGGSGEAVKMVEAASGLMRKNRGATERNLLIIRQFLG